MLPAPRGSRRTPGIRSCYAGGLTKSTRDRGMAAILRKPSCRRATPARDRGLLQIENLTLQLGQRYSEETPMDFTIPKHINDLIADIDAFIEREIVPLQAQDDNERFFDHRREWARTDFEHGGFRRKDWEQLLGEMGRRADKAGFLRLALPPEFGGKNIGNLAMAIIREHLAAKGLGLHNDLQNETSVVGNFPQVLMFRDFGTEHHKKTYLAGML